MTPDSEPGEAPGATAPSHGVHNEFHGAADFVVMARDITGRISYSPTFVTAATDPLDLASRELTRMVGSQWRSELGLRGLFTANPLAIRWTTDRGRLSDHEQLIGGHVDGERSDLRSLADSFLSLPNRRLVMLGGIGSGKSTLAALLLLSLLEQSSPNDPVPVLLPLASWDPALQHLNTWLAARLNEDYPRLRSHEFGRGAAKRLIEARRVLPILDGLDEMPTHCRALALHHLNSALAGGSPVVLTCRTGEYEATVRDAGVLRHATAIHANPVEPREAFNHLSRAVTPQRQPQWQPVFEALEADHRSPLAIALESPLMISLLLAVYNAPEAQPGRLLDPVFFPDSTTIENHLLDRLVLTAFTSGPPPSEVPWRHRRWDSQNAQRWLRRLAVDLTRRGSEDLTWWQLHQRSPAWLRALNTGIISGMACFIFLVILAITGLFGRVDSAGLAASAVLSVIAGVFGGWVITGASGPYEPGRKLTESERLWNLRIRFRLQTPGKDLFRTGGLMVLIWVGLWVVIMTVGAVMIAWKQLHGEGISFSSGGREMSTGELIESARFFVVFPAALGAMLWGLGWLARPFNSEDAATMRIGLRIARRKAMSLLLIFCLPVLALFSLGMTAWSLLIGFLAILRSAWGCYARCRIWLTVTGRLPWRLTAFLEDAHRLGILHQYGTVYQFRHAKLRERLASARPTR
ncbi:NACHT domain-containing protein [Streptomyces sp. SUK 48]|uniref:NACHT domain-containing protein n=1 Tax=Streptomyces sp. SUK 48 TaxID=2582831 RepID=UPI00129BDF7B|nr:NACHT domain-containing protein [Streptomyces sp. SUK 48]